MPSQIRSGATRGLAARIFGYDIFISFALGASPRGTRSYASDLARRLRERDYTVFFSEDEATAGGQLDDALKTALRRSGILVVVANRGTLADPRWVRVEVEEFRRLHPGRPVIPVSIGSALQDSALGAAAQDWLAHQDRIWVDDTQQACDQGIASDETVDRLATAPTAVRAITRWRWTQRAAFAVLAGVTAAALWFARSDRLNAELAQNNAAQAVANAASATANAELARRNEVQAVANAASAVRESERAGKAEVLARDEAAAARAAQKRALSGRLAAESQLARESDSRYALLLAREAWATDRTPEAQRAMLTALGEPVALPVAAGLGNLRRVSRSADGHFVAAAGPGKVVHLWRFETGSSAAAPESSKLTLADAVQDLAFSPDGRTLATMDSKGRLQLWAPETGRETALALQDPDVRLGWALAWHPKGRTVAIGASGSDGGQFFAFWDIIERRRVGEPLRNDETYGVFKIAFSPSGDRFAATGIGHVYVWDLKTRLALVPRIATRSAPRFVAFTSEDRLVFDGPGYEATPWLLWNNTGEKPTYSLTNEVASFAYAAAAGIVATGSGFRGIQLWHSDHASPIGRPMQLHEWSVMDLAFSPDGRELVSVGHEGRVVRWLLDTGSHRLRAAGWPAIERGDADLTTSSDQRWAVLLQRDGRIEWRDARSGAVEVARERAGKAQEGLAVAADGSAALRVGGERIAVHARGQGSPRCATDKAAGTVVFSPDGRWLATSHREDPAVRLWRASDCRALAPAPRSGENVYFRPFAFTADGRGLWVVENATVKRWSIGASRFDAAPALAAPLALALAVDPLGRYLAVAHNVGLTTLIELRAGGRTTTLSGPHGSNTVRALAFSPNGLWLATAGDDGRAVLWDLDIGQAAGPAITTGQGQLRRIAFSVDGKTLLTGGTDRPATAAWTVDPDDWAERICAVTRRNLSCAEFQRVMGRQQPYHRTCPAWPWPDDIRMCRRG